MTCDVIDTQDWQGANVDTIGTSGFGVLGGEVSPTDYLFNALTLPADANKEVCGRITAWPAVGTLYAYENTHYVYSRGGDGADSFQYQVYIDGIAVGSPRTVTLADDSADPGVPVQNLPAAALLCLATIMSAAPTTKQAPLSSADTLLIVSL